MCWKMMSHIWEKVQDVRPTAKYVLLCLVNHASGDGKRGYCWPGINRICRLTGLGRTTVIRALAELEEKGYIRREKKPGCVNVYRLTVQPGDLPPPARERPTDEAPADTNDEGLHNDDQPTGNPTTGNPIDDMDGDPTDSDPTARARADATASGRSAASSSDAGSAAADQGGRAKAKALGSEAVAEAPPDLSDVERRLNTWLRLASRIGGRRLRELTEPLPEQARNELLDVAYEQMRDLWRLSDDEIVEWVESVAHRLRQLLTEPA